MDSIATSEDTSTLHREVDRLKADLQRLRLDFSQLVGDAVHAAKAGAGEARDRVADRARAAAAKGRESVEAVEEQVAAHPFIALAGAFATGLLAGVVLARKD